MYPSDPDEDVLLLHHQKSTGTPCRILGMCWLAQYLSVCGEETHDELPRAIGQLHQHNLNRIHLEKS